MCNYKPVIICKFQDTVHPAYANDIWTTAGLIICSKERDKKSAGVCAKCSSLMVQESFLGEESIMVSQSKNDP